MPKPIEEYFDKILCINLARRTDRWQQVLEECDRFGLTRVGRFEAVDGDTLGISPENWRHRGNAGCVASHRAILKLIIENRWHRTLVLEDDFKIIHLDFHQKFSELIPLVPLDWDMVYLGGHYADPPVSRINEHVIKCGRMFTTSSYGITCDFAEKMIPHLTGSGPIDCIYSEYTANNNCYILQPRLMVQRAGYSDLSYQVIDNELCMLDTRHEEMV